MKLSELLRNAQTTFDRHGDMEVWIEALPGEQIDASDTEIDTTRIGGRAFTIMSEDADKWRNAREDAVMGHRL
jgi:hypothetical protein